MFTYPPPQLRTASYTSELAQRYFAHWSPYLISQSIQLGWVGVAGDTKTEKMYPKKHLPFQLFPSSNPLANGKVPNNSPDAEVVSLKSIEIIIL